MARGHAASSILRAAVAIIAPEKGLLATICYSRRHVHGSALPAIVFITTGVGSPTTSPTRTAPRRGHLEVFSRVVTEVKVRPSKGSESRLICSATVRSASKTALIY